MPTENWRRWQTVVSEPPQRIPTAYRNPTRGVVFRILTGSRFPSRAVDGVSDRSLQAADLRLIGGNLIRQRRILLLNLLILRLQRIVAALRDAGGESDRCHEREHQHTASQTICHRFESPQLDDRSQRVRGLLSGTCRRRK